jgi:hypothetical protein
VLQLFRKGTDSNQQGRSGNSLGREGVTMATPEMSPEYHEAAQALETFKEAMLVAIPTQEPIPLNICLAAWDSLSFSFGEWQKIEAAASGQIDQLRAELFFMNTNVAGTA